ncbi:glycosyltransferase [Algoriphagus sp. AGSA1]|uniref:glycosyltransferase n=1 Tax=Algoriphagus sp. AGSA1 TaxID=2907213 RepID=UPI001F48FA85|nr:glycosyltransferase [Algoriphagus sp. AGSA1]MCE7053706.1 glycosyltransferase [Algoriphagus sp. AGSA1]
MTKKIIFITRRYPYYTTEAFIESEIDYIAQKFDEVIIFPTEISDYKRHVPNNVKVVDDFAYVFKNKIKRSVVTVFSITLYKAIFSHLKLIKTVSDLKLIIKYISSYLAYYDFFSNLEEIDSAGIVYTYWFNEAPLAFSEIKKQRRKSFKVISRAHRYDIYEGLESTLPFWVYRQKTIEQTDCIYSISLNGKEYLERKYSSQKSNIKVSKLGVYDRGLIAKNSIGNNHTIVSVSRVHPMKRIGFILDSVVAFAKTVPYRKIVWTHFGDGDELLTIKKKAQAIKPENLVVNFKGNVANSQIYEHYATEPTDLFINLSISEGIPVSIMEAQSFGIPVIATNVGGSCEIVVTQTGILLSENPIIEDVVNALNSVLIEKSINNMKVKEHWKDNFDAERNYSEFSNAISKLI